MDINKKLTEIWSKYQGQFANPLLNEILGRGHVYAIPERKDILITGINPSFVEKNKDEENYYTYGIAKNRYFTQLSKIVNKPDAAYLDLFYFRHTKQEGIKLFCEEEKGLHFLAEQLALTQGSIENIVQPKIILVMNKGSWGFWGKSPKCVWMGYEFKKVGNIDLKKGEAYKITGSQNSPERVYQEPKTNLQGTLVYFSINVNRASNEDLAIIKGEVDKLRALA